MQPLAGFQSVDIGFSRTGSMQAVDLDMIRSLYIGIPMS